MMFDTKMTIVIMIALLAMTALKYALPQLEEVFGIQFLIYFVAFAGMIVLMHWVGFIEGKDEGFRKGLMENESPFFYLPHGGIE